MVLTALARFVDDIVTEQVALGVTQYLMLGAGLDTFAQRRPEIASRMRIFEIDQPETQAWKRQRLIDVGSGIPGWLRLVSVDFEAGDAWWERVAADLTERYFAGRTDGLRPSSGESFLIATT